LDYLNLPVLKDKNKATLYFTCPPCILLCMAGGNFF
jgi:hypothetical protein